MKRTRVSALAALIFGLALSPIAVAATYKVTLLHPVGFVESQAAANSGNSQVGKGRLPGAPIHYHALLWQGTAASAVDLHPAGFSDSFAVDVSGATQVGYGNIGSQQRALLWNGSAASVVDLHPANFALTNARAISGNTQGGLGVGIATGFNDHALLWHGSAASVVDLNPAGFTNSYIT